MWYNDGGHELGHALGLREVKIMKKRIITPIVALIVVLGGVFALWKIDAIKKGDITETSAEKKGGIMIQGSEPLLTEEELFGTGIIVRGVFTWLEDTRSFDIGEDKPLRCDVYGIEVLEYLYDETEDYADKIYAALWAGLVLPDIFESGKEYIFIMYNTGEVAGDNIFSFYSTQQGIFATNENGKYKISTCGDRELSCEYIKALVEKYH